MGVKVYHNGNWIEFSTGSNATASFLVQDEGNDLVGLATALNFKGSGVTASNTSGNPSTKEIEITGVTTFLALSDTPTSYVGTAGSVVTVNSSEDGLVFLEADSTGLGRDNYVDSASFGSLPQGGARLTLTYAGPDSGTLTDVTADLTINTLAIGFTQLSDTPTNYTGVGNSFVRVKSSEDGLEFVSQVPGTAVGAVGINSQVQYNDNGALNGAAGLFYFKGDESDGNPGNKLILKPNYTDYTSTTEPAKYGGGAIVAQSNNESSTISIPWNEAGITADGGLELMRRRIESPQGGPYIDFRAQSVDKDARIQMDYALYSGAIDTSHGDYSAITFQTGGTGYYNWQSATSGRVTEKIRIGRNGEIGILAGSQIPSPNQGPYNDIQPGTAGSNNPIVDSNRTEADKYGTNGQVLMSGGYGNSVFWGTNGAGNSLWTQNTVGIYRDSDVMIRRSDNANDASLAVHGSILSGTAGSSKNVLDLRSQTANADCLTFRSVRITEDTTGAGNPDWYSAAWRIQRRVDVTDQVYIQFGAGNNNPSGTDSNEDIIFGNTGGERLRMESSGQLLIGQSSIINGVFGSAPPRFSVSTPTASPAIFATFSNDIYGSRIDLLKSRDETIGSHTVLQSGDSIGEIYFGGSDGDQFHAGALIQSVVASGVGNDDMPADLRFFTNGGTTTVTERLRITHDGDVGIGTFDPTGTNAISGNNAKLAVGIVTCRELYVNGNQITSSGGGGSSDPVGTIVAWGGSVSSIPSGYQLCDGGITQTSALQAITGANVPDLRSRFIVGANDVSGTGTYPGVGVGSTGGSANAVLVAHQHTIDVRTGGGTDHDNVPKNDGDGANSTESTNIVGKDAAGNDNNLQQGTNANLPPYYALCYIIKHTASSGSGGGGGNYESYIASLSGNNNIEFTNIPSWATKITLLGENFLLPEPSGGTNQSIGSLLEFGGNSGYLGSTAYTYTTSFITKSTSGSNTYGISEFENNNTPYAPYILLNSSSEGDGPILSQVFFTFEKVKGQNKWVYSGSTANRKGIPSDTFEDFRFLNEFTGSFTASEGITKLKLRSFSDSTSPASNYTGGTLTAIYEGEGGGGSSSVTPAVEVEQLSSQFVMPSQSFSTILSINITPSTANSSMLVQLTGYAFSPVAAERFEIRLRRDTTVLKTWSNTNTGDAEYLDYPVKDTFTHGTSQISYVLEGRQSTSGSIGPAQVSKRTNLVIQEIV